MKRVPYTKLSDVTSRGDVAVRKTKSEDAYRTWTFLIHLARLSKSNQGSAHRFSRITVYNTILAYLLDDVVNVGSDELTVAGDSRGCAEDERRRMLRCNGKGEALGLKTMRVKRCGL